MSGLTRLCPGGGHRHDRASVNLKDRVTTEEWRKLVQLYNDSQKRQERKHYSLSSLMSVWLRQLVSLL